MDEIKKKLYRFREKRIELNTVFKYVGHLLEENDTHFIIFDLKTKKEYRLLKTDSSMEEFSQ